MINKIPLYDEVESGDNVSSERLLQYIIDRLDSLEKNINIKTQDKSNNFYIRVPKYELEFTFFNSGLFSSNETDELIRIFMKYSSLIRHDVLNERKIFLVSVIIDKVDMNDLKNEIDEWLVPKDNISYSCKRKSEDK